MKILIDSIIGEIPANPASHQAAHAYLRAMQIKERNPDATVTVASSSTQPDWDEYDTVLVYHGMAFNGAINMPGGMSEKMASKLRKVAQTVRCKIASLDIPMPDYANLIAMRKDNLLTPLELTALMCRCSEGYAHEVQKFLEGETVVIGDSHALSLGSPRSYVSRNDFLTLHGALKRGLTNVGFFAQPDAKQVFGKEDIGRLVLYFGNIDIRHHVCRIGVTQGQQVRVVEDLVQRYADQVIPLADSIRKITVVAPLPIESPSRQIPKSGWHEGRPFWGSWAERDFAAMVFRERLEKHFCSISNVDIYYHPECYCNGRMELDFKVMEKPRSVHMSREWYPYDYTTGLPNEKLAAWKNSIKLLVA